MEYSVVRKANKKIMLLTILSLMLGVVLVGNLFNLMFRGKTFFADVDFRQAEGVSITSTIARAERGSISDGNGNVIAIDKRVYKIIFILSPTHKKTIINEAGEKEMIEDYVKNPGSTAEKISEILGVNQDYVYSRLILDKYQVEIGSAGSNLDAETKRKIEELNLPGIYFENGVKRYYPMGQFASHLIGYLNSENSKGLAGIERTLNEYLAGVNGKQTYYSDVNKNRISGGEIESTEAENGYNVQLTLNNAIQRKVGEMLQNIMNIGSDVDKAWAIVMDAKTGAIYGYDSSPSFNPNTMNITDYNDYCASLPYEPGSTMKSITYAAAIDMGHFNKEAQFNANNYYVDTDKNGNLKRGKTAGLPVIHNSGNKQYGMTTFERAFINSYNVGTVTLLEEQIGKSKWESYLDAFGFFKPVNVYGISEGSNYGRYDFSNAFSLACSSFGSGMSCNALQLLQAYTAFCNEGTMVKPYIIKSITEPTTGEIVYQGGREEAGKPIKAATAKQVLELMYQVCHSGYHISAHTLEMPEISVGCKTGTAPVANEKGAYGDDIIHSVMITLPADDPQILVYVAYQDSRDVQRNFKYIKSLLRCCVEELDLTNTQKRGETEPLREIFVMDNLKNHTLDYAKGVLNKYGVNLILLGNGDSVIKQYPIAESRAITGQRVILLTSLDGIVMPDMTGWSRNEVMAFWDMTGIGIKTEGYGYVVSQSIQPGTLLEKGTVINLKLQD